VKRIKEMRRREEEKGKGEGKEASERYTIPFFFTASIPADEN